mmetsp:Transcript_17122/g.37452  ORF Transcript_17122/g.37452 Transcript_17122/m.37452 type:complete len:217 (+) Transcript_17122:132-782(+)
MAVPQVIVSSVVDAAVSFVKDIFQNKFSVDKDNKDDLLREDNDPALMSTTTTTTITRSTVNERGARSTTTLTQITSKQMVMNYNDKISQKSLENNNTRNNNRLLANNTQQKQQQRRGQGQRQEGLTKEVKFSRQKKNNSIHRATPQTTTTKRSQSVPTRPPTARRVFTKAPKGSSTTPNNGKQYPLHQITNTTVTRPQTKSTRPITSSRFLVKKRK